MRCLRAGESQVFGGSAAIETSQLERAVDGFGAAIGKKDAVETGPLRELASQRALKRVVKKIGKMDARAGFAANRLDDTGMRVAESVDGDAAEEIEIFLAAGVEDVAAAAMREDDGLTFVSRQQKLVWRRADGSRLWRARGCGLPGSIGRRRWRVSCVELAHHAAERAACARREVRGERACREWLRVILDARVRPSATPGARASGAAPPTMRTSRTPPSRARLAASSLRIMPPETTRALDEALDFFAGDGGEDFFSVEHAGDVGEINQLVGTEKFGASGSHVIGIDVVELDCRGRGRGMERRERKPSRQSDSMKAMFIPVR